MPQAHGFFLSAALQGHQDSEEDTISEGHGDEVQDRDCEQSGAPPLALRMSHLASVVSLTSLVMVPFETSGATAMKCI